MFTGVLDRMFSLINCARTLSVMLGRSTLAAAFTGLCVGCFFRLLRTGSNTARLGLWLEPLDLMECGDLLIDLLRFALPKSFFPRPLACGVSSAAALLEVVDFSRSSSVACLDVLGYARSLCVCEVGSYLPSMVRVGERMAGWAVEVVEECIPRVLLLLSCSF